MSAKTPRVWTVYVEDPAQPTEQVWLDRPEWFGQLDRQLRELRWEVRELRKQLMPPTESRT